MLSLVAPRFQYLRSTDASRMGGLCARGDLLLRGAVHLAATFRPPCSVRQLPGPRGKLHLALPALHLHVCGPGQLLRPAGLPVCHANAIRCLAVHDRK